MKEVKFGRLERKVVVEVRRTVEDQPPLVVAGVRSLSALRSRLIDRLLNIFSEKRAERGEIIYGAQGDELARNISHRGAFE